VPALPEEETMKYEVVETVYGKYNKYDIIKKDGGLLGSPKFYIYKDGEYHRGSFSSFKDAVEAAQQER
jgi:hypothetical protein